MARQVAHCKAEWANVAGEMIGVTGGTGFVGRRLIAHLAKEGAVRVMALDTPQDLVSHAEFVIGDLACEETVNGFARGCGSIIHLAGIAHSSLRTKAAKERAYSVNVEGTRVVVRAALRHGVRRLLFVSTAHVYAGHSGVNIDEAAPTGATTFYGGTKLQGEEAVREAGKSGLEVVIVRPCLIYGPGARFNLHRMMAGIDRGYYFHISGCNPMRSFLSLENMVRALRHLTHCSFSAGIYNLADESPYSLIEFANELADRMKRPRPRTIPSALISAAGMIGSTLQKLGISLPISNEAVAKLTSHFTISTRRLAGAGFDWECGGGALRQEMVDQYLDSQHSNCRQARRTVK